MFSLRKAAFVLESPALIILISNLLVAQLATSTSVKSIIGSSGRIDSDWLRTNGKWIVDSKGDFVILHGVNFHGYEVGAFNDHTEADYQRIKNWGFNIVRLPIAWSYIEPIPGVYNDSYFSAYVDRDIAWAKKNGLSIILDMHQWIWSPHFTYPGKGTNGVPSWSVRGYPDSAYGKNQSVADFWLGKGLNGTIASLTNPSMKDRYVEAWKHVALRYANEPTIMAYDLFNEPPDATAEWLTTPQVSDALFSLYAKLIDAIRDVDSKHILIYQALGGGAWWARLIDLPNMAFSTHFYDLDRTYDGNKSKIENDFLARRWNAPVEDPINSWNIPILIGEFGYNDNWENSELWVRDVLSIFDKYQIKTQLWWAYFKSDTFGKALLLRNGTERIQVKYLDRPYPRVTSFVPLHWSFNCDKEEFAIEVANGTHWLQIYIPSRYYASFTFHTNATVLSKFWNKEFGILIIQFVVEKPTEVIIQMLPESC